MWLKKSLWFMLIFSKFLLVTVLVSGILAFFFPIVGGIVFILFIIGSFPAAAKEFKEERLPKIQANNIKKAYRKLDDEFQGFEDALQVTRRGMF